MTGVHTSMVKLPAPRGFSLRLIMPRGRSILLATSSGIVLFLAFMGLQRRRIAFEYNSILFVMHCLVPLASLCRSIMLATSSGIGLFLAFIGLQAQQGLGVSTYSATSIVTLGAPMATLTLRSTTFG